MGEIREFPIRGSRPQPAIRSAAARPDGPALSGGPLVLHSVGRIAMAQGMLMARFAMSEGYAMQYLSDQAALHDLTMVQLAERVIERVCAS